MEKEEFYTECARLLGTDYTLVSVITHNRRTNRWGPREPGNGRFPGFGLIRWFGPACIHVSLVKPIHVNKTFTSPEAVLKLLG